MSHRLAGRNRPQQVIGALYSANEALSSAHRQTKFARMAVSPYRFFGACDNLYWQDAWFDWRFALFGGWPDTQTWLHGDAQVAHFAAVGYPHQPIRYGLIGVDRALIGDYQFDLWRLSTSLVLDARENAGLSVKAVDKALWALASGYLETLKVHRDGQTLKVGTLNGAKGPLKAFLGKVADKQHPQRSLDKWTELTESKGRQFASRPGQLANLPADVASRLKRIIENEYQQTLPVSAKEGDAGHFRVQDTARRLNASGVEHYYVLLEGGGERQHDDVIVEVKEQRVPEAFHHLGKADQQGWRKLFPNEGLRHAAAFHALSAHADAYLGWLTLNDRVFSVRQMPGFKKRLPSHKLKGKAYGKLARQWGEILAAQHMIGAEALNRGESGFAAAVCGRIEGREDAFVDSICTFARSYADCVEQDYRLFNEHFMAQGA
ncbi:DUF2252 family protein [Vreelandella sp. EE22]